MQDIIDVNLISLVLTIVALVFAIIQTVLAIFQGRKAKEQTNNLINIEENFENQMVNLEKIEKSLSTRYLHEFPKYHNDIAELISRAENNIMFFYDIPAYGVMSNKEGWFMIESAIRKKILDGIDISLTLYSESKRKAVLMEQFQNSNESFDKWFEDEENKEKLKSFLDSYNYKYDLNKFSLDEYVEASNSIQKQIHSEVFRTINTVEINDFMPIYFWMIDDKIDSRAEAIISIPAFTSDTMEFGFITSDQKFIEALKKLKGRYNKS